MKKKPKAAPELKEQKETKKRPSKTDAAAAVPRTISAAVASGTQTLRKTLAKATRRAAAKIHASLKTKTPAGKKTTPAAPAVAQPSPAKRKLAEPPEIPPILLERDEPSASPASGPGEKFSLGATPPAQSFSGGELPESYGTKKLFLTARDPHWLYAHWDLTHEQQNACNADSTDGHLILRVYAGKIEGHPACEIHVHPDSRHWFAHVEGAGTSYAAELGYYSALGQWRRVATSSGTVTPPDAAAQDEAVEFATIPFEFPFYSLMRIIEEAVRDNKPLALAIEELRRAGHSGLPRFSRSSQTPADSSVRPWTPEQAEALAKIINIDETRRVWMGSLEITELIRRRLAREAFSPTTAFGASARPASSSPTSPLGGAPAEKPRGFWFNVNAELIIYGATEPGAKVTLGGHEIQLRADGTFSFRFALPDGKYDLPAVAIAADDTDGRAANLKFSRETEYLGAVGATPQDPSLKPPTPDNL